MGVSDGEVGTGGVWGADDNGEGVKGGKEGMEDVGVDGGR